MSRGPKTSKRPKTSRGLKIKKTKNKQKATKQG